MASHPNVPVKDSHLHQAVTFAFENADESIEDVKKALTDHSQRASKSLDRLYTTNLLDRFSFVQDYWKQLQKDYLTKDNRCNPKVMTFIEAARQAGYQQGYADGQMNASIEEACDVAQEAYDTGFNDAGGTQLHPVRHGLIGFAFGAAVIFLSRKK